MMGFGTDLPHDSNIPSFQHSIIPMACPCLAVPEGRIETRNGHFRNVRLPFTSLSRVRQWPYSYLSFSAFCPAGTSILTISAHPSGDQGNPTWAHGLGGDCRATEMWNTYRDGFSVKVGSHVPVRT